MGTLFVVGLGPGDAGNMTKNARSCLENADVIVGYTGYIRMLQARFSEKTFHATGMTGERERCRLAIQLAEAGKTVCVVSSGDSGVYGMASLIHEQAEGHADLKIVVIPGVTAAVSGAALLGAPIGHDFSVISLSDLLTPWSQIERRLQAAAMGDFALCLYNPGSSKRADHLKRACTVLLQYLPEERLCGIAWEIGRDDQSLTLLTLAELREMQLGMNATVFIGNSQTRRINGRMVTPRGYPHA